MLGCDPPERACASAGSAKSGEPQRHQSPCREFGDRGGLECRREIGGGEGVRVWRPTEPVGVTPWLASSATVTGAEKDCTYPKMFMKSRPAPPSTEET